jgi:hypothetical protein
MKINYLLLTLLALSWLSGCVRQPVNNQISYLGQDAPGTLRMRVTGFGQKQVEIEEDGQRKAIEHLLYVGLPDATGAEVKNTDFRLPMVQNKASVQGLPFLRTFLADGGYKPFITNVSVLDNNKSRASNNQRTLPLAISVSYDALRRHMEQHGVIRKFGY